MKRILIFMIFLQSIFSSKIESAEVGSAEAATVGREEGEEIQQVRLGGRSTHGNKGLWSIQNAWEYFKGENFSSWEWEVDILYGLTERLSLELFVPFFLKNKFLNFTSRGPGDVILDLQWNFFSKGPNSAIIAAGPKFPTGKLLSKFPPTGTGTWDINLEFSALHASDNWYFGFVLEALITTKHKTGLKPANEYVYELIFGKPVKLFNGTLTFNAELFGSYLEPDRFNGEILPDTGGNVIYFGPLVSFLYGSFLFDISFQWAATQRLLGNLQPKNEYTTLVACTFTF